MPAELQENVLPRYDDQMRETFVAMSGLYVSGDTWGQAIRCFAHGGLGLRASARHAHAAYIGSRTQTRDGCFVLERDFQWEAADTNSSLSNSIDAYNLEVDPADRVNVDQAESLRQQALSKSLDAAEHAHDMAGCPSGEACMSREQFRNELKVRSLPNIYPADSFCELCGDIMDRKGRRAVVRSCGGDRTRRHNWVRYCIWKLESAVHQSPKQQKPCLLQLSTSPTLLVAAPPMFLTLWALRHWRSVALDVAITSPTRNDFVLQASRSPGAAAKADEQSKRMYLNIAADCFQQGFNFIPLVGELPGG